MARVSTLVRTDRSVASSGLGGMVNIVLLLAHSIEEHDQLRLLADIGHQVFSIGGYIDPRHPHDPTT